MGPLHLCTVHLCLFPDVGVFRTNLISSHFITLYMCLLSKIKPLKPSYSTNTGINEASIQRIYVHIFPPPPFVPLRMRALCHGPECIPGSDSILAVAPRVIHGELPAQESTLGRSWEEKDAPTTESRSRPLAKKWTVMTVQPNYRTAMAHT